MAHSRLAPRNDLAQEEVLRQLRYDPETGVLYRRPIEEKNRMDRMRNSRFANKPVTYRNSTGHVQLQIGGHHYLAHRIIWLMVYGEWPARDIDHINGVRDDNRLANLRLATPSQNASNSRLRKNKSGFRGVWRQYGKWLARIRADGKSIYLGAFDTVEDAARAYDAAAAELHGAFAYLNR